MVSWESRLTLHPPLVWFSISHFISSHVGRTRELSAPVLASKMHDWMYILYIQSIHTGTYLHVRNALKFSCDACLSLVLDVQTCTLTFRYNSASLRTVPKHFKWTRWKLPCRSLGSSVTFSRFFSPSSLAFGILGPSHPRREQSSLRLDRFAKYFLDDQFDGHWLYVLAVTAEMWAEISQISLAQCHILQFHRSTNCCSITPVLTFTFSNICLHAYRNRLQ